MLGIAAGRNVARMTDVHTLWDRSIDLLPHKAVRFVGPVVAKQQNAIAIIVHCAVPKPTARVWLRDNAVLPRWRFFPHLGLPDYLEFGVHSLRSSQAGSGSG